MYNYYGYLFDFSNKENIVVDQRILDYLKMRLTEKRYLHSFSVANLAYDIALSNKLENPEKYFISGLLHDIGKYVDKDTTLKIMKGIYEEYIDLPEYAYHSFVGAYLAKTELHIEDEELLNAILFHTTGKDNLTPLEMIVFASDKIEPLRRFNSIDEINLMKRNFLKGFKQVIYKDRIFQIEKKSESNFLSNAMYQFYL